MSRRWTAWSRSSKNWRAADQALALFEEGSKLAGSCSAMLDKAEQKVTKLLQADAGAEGPFEASDSSPQS